MVFLSSFESVVSKLEKRSKNRASKKFVFNTRATAKERITRISSNNYNFLIFLSFAFGKDEVGGSNPPSSSKKPCFLSKAGLFLYFSTNLICGSGWQRRPEDVFHCPPKIVWPTRSGCLIFVSNLASTITQQQKRALFVEAVTLVTWAKQQEENSCIPQNTLSAFST